MESTTKEIAALLRSTDDMADQFVERVQARVGAPVTSAEVLAAIKKISAKSLSMEKVVDKVQKGKQSTRTQTPKQPATTRSSANAGTRPPAPDPARNAKTTLEKLEEVLVDNWSRAEIEGLQPERMSAEAFVNSVYQFTDRREGTRSRILQAAKQLDHDDVMLTPALVADVVHELFQA
jgi:hypothetical protein